MYSPVLQRRPEHRLHVHALRQVAAHVREKPTPSSHRLASPLSRTGKSDSCRDYIVFPRLVVDMLL